MRTSAAAAEDQSCTSKLKNVCLSIAARTGAPLPRIFVNLGVSVTGRATMFIHAV